MADPLTTQAHPLLPLAEHRPAVVLDTNVVLDWLVFRDPGCEALANRLVARHLAWHSTAAMRGELASVLPRPQLSPWIANCEHILSEFDRWAIVIGSTLPVETDAPQCRDPDDQKFVELALAVGARWLFTRDRALLDLGKAARKRGVEILTPADWTRRYASAPP